MDMNSLGISETGTILRGSSTMEQKIRNNTNFTEPFCGPQMTGSLTNYQSRKTNNNQIESKEENIRINHLYIKDELYISSLDEYRYKYCEYGNEYDLMKGNQYLTLEEKRKLIMEKKIKFIVGDFLI